MVAVSGGDCHSEALLDDGTVWTWGCDNVGELGNGSNLDCPLPVQVLGLAGIAIIAARDYHNTVLRDDETLWSWGFNPNGQLGNGTNVDSNVPVMVLGLP